MYLFYNMILMILTATVSVCAVSGSDSVVNSDFEGKSLVAMGTSLDNPLLKLLGRTFERLEKDVLKDIDNKTTFVLGQVNKDNSSLEQRLVSERRELIDIICQLHPCTEWHDWTACSAKFNGTFGAQTRSRTCGVKASKLCSGNGQEQKETDTRICEGSRCPMNYIFTLNGFCMRVHKYSKTWTSAQAACKQESGYLMNIDSQLKWADVNNTLKQLSLSGIEFWIDGTRMLPGGAWRYEYGPLDTAFEIWDAGEPGASDDCKAYVLAEWRGRPCGDSYYFICEVV